MKNTKPTFLLVVLEPQMNSIQSQVVMQTWQEVMEIFVRTMAHFFTVHAEAAEFQNIDKEVAKFLSLVDQQKFDEAYGAFIRGSRNTVMEICGVYRMSQGNFVKQRIEILKASA